jgi:hypothetical protein
MDLVSCYHAGESLLQGEKNHKVTTASVVKYFRRTQVCSKNTFMITGAKYLNHVKADRK